MTSLHRKGFTLVEMLVVVVIIAMLVGLLIPAVAGARARSRQTQCLNNQHELGLALLQYETTKGFLPGYTNYVKGGANNLTWAQVLFPYMGRNDVWNVVRTSSVNPGDLPKKLPQLICPSDDADRSFALSYVGNCGQYTPGNALPPLYGLFVKRDKATNAKAVSISSIRDGAVNTILFSENLQATQWFPLDAAKLATGVVPRVPYIVGVGMMWTWPISQKCVAQSCKPAEGVAPVNGCVNEAPPFPWSATAETDAAVLTYRHYARPSASHPGGVIVTYADGHQDILDPNIDATVYADLLDPAGNGQRPGPTP